MGLFDDLQPDDNNKDKIISKFHEWWTDNEIRDDVLPYLIDKNFIDTFSDQLESHSTENHSEHKSFCKILYDFVGKDFLVNSDDYLRNRFLYLIIKKQLSMNISFPERFLKCLVQNIKSKYSGSCKVCDRHWNAEECIYQQKLGLKNSLCCLNKKCVTKQQQSLLDNLKDFIENLGRGIDYNKFCKELALELDLPIEVANTHRYESKLLPDTAIPLGDLPRLHDYQSSIRLQILDMLENYTPETCRALVALPTGSGKTRLVVETLIDWINNGKKGKEDKRFILWIVDKKELCQQAFDAFYSIFQHKGRKNSSLKLHPIYDNRAKNIRDMLYQNLDNSDYANEQYNVIVASIQSLYNMSKNFDEGSLPKLGKFTSVVIIDEAHHAIGANKSYNNVLKALGFEFRKKEVHKHKTCLLGLTATPFRGDDKTTTTVDLLRRFGTRILWPSISYDINENYISPHASLKVQKYGHQNEQIRLYGEGSYSLIDEKIVAYHFLILLHNGNDDTIKIFDDIVKNPNIDFSFKEPGQYEIRLTVKDTKSESKNSAVSYVNILSTPVSNKKSNVEEMKKLYERLIKQEILATPHHYVVNYSKSIKITHKEREQFKLFHDIPEGAIQRIGYDPNRNKLILKKLVSIIKCESRKSILFFACSINHSKHISMTLNVFYGIKSASVDHTVRREERDKIMNDFRQGKISVLCNFNILTTGFDSPKVDCVFVARPTYSHLLYNQMIGRGLRGPKNNGTKDCIIVDISDNIQLELDEKIDESWQFFEYIYKTIYDESILDPQTCFRCFGDTDSNCFLCDGTGIITHKNYLNKNRSGKCNKKMTNDKSTHIKEKEHDISTIMESIYNVINFNPDKLFDEDSIMEQASIEEKHRDKIKPILEGFERLDKTVKICEKWTHNSNIEKKKKRYAKVVIIDMIIEILNEQCTDEDILKQKIEFNLRAKNLLESARERIELIECVIDKMIQEGRIKRIKNTLYIRGHE